MMMQEANYDTSFEVIRNYSLLLAMHIIQLHKFSLFDTLQNVITSGQGEPALSVVQYSLSFTKNL
jgi:hypothetical protein